MTEILTDEYDANAINIVYFFSSKSRFRKFPNSYNNDLFDLLSSTYSMSNERAEVCQALPLVILAVFSVVD